MTEYSGPVEEEPLPSKDWPSVTKGIGNGILDEGGFPYNLINFNNATNTAELTAANLGDNVRRSHAIIDGFNHKIDENLTLELPAVTTATTYYVALQFDPVRGTEHGMPVKAVVVTKLDYTGGKNYLTLWTVRREPNQLLTDATVRHLRPRVAPFQTVAHRGDLQDPSKVLWGSAALVHGGSSGEDRDILVATGGSESGADTWASLLDPPWDTYGDYENAVGGVANGGPKEIQRTGRTRKMQGRVGRRDGSTYSDASGAGYLIATLGSADRPRYTKSPLVRCGGGSNGPKARGFVSIDRGNSEVRLYITEGSCLWVDLGTIEWTV